MLAHDGPILVAPAMNTRMWQHPATRANHELLLARGVEVVGPASGELAEGEVGVGRMAEPEEIVARAEAMLAAVALARAQARVVTAGGTREPIDAVRYVGNRSSGRMGLALADEARRRGARVTLLAANVSVQPPHGVEVVSTPTAADLEREALARGDADVILMVAAVADYRAADADRRQAAEGCRRLADRADADHRHRQGARRRAAPRAGARRVRCRAGGRRARAQAGDAARQERRSRRLQRCGTQRHRLRQPRQRGHADHRDGDRLVPHAPKPVIAVAVLDEVERLLEGR